MTVIDPHPTPCRVPPGPNDLAEHTLYACPRWLHVLERGGRTPAAYLTCGPDGRHLGLLPLHHGAPTANARYTLAQLARGLDGYPPDRAVSYGGPVSAYQTEVPTIRAAAPTAARELIALADERSRAVNRSLLVPYLTTRAVRHLPADLGGRLVLEAFEAWFETTAGGIDECLTGLPHKRRHNVRRDRRAFREAGLTGGSSRSAPVWRPWRRWWSRPLAGTGSPVGRHRWWLT